jgi:hypothetical protein
VHPCEGRITTGFAGNLCAKGTDRPDVCAARSLRQSPVEMQLDLAIGRDPSGEDIQARRPDMLPKARALCRDVACVDAD